MKRFLVIVVCAVLFYFGCARVQVEAPKEPIKVDISMRLDIYQHVIQDIDAIENLVSGDPAKTGPGDDSSFLPLFVKSAYAQDELSQEVEQAALRRRERYNQITAWGAQGIIGENHRGLLEIRDRAKGGTAVQNVVQEENQDRMSIYGSIAEKNGITVQEVQSIYSQKLQEKVPGGTPIEVYNKTTGGYEWRVR
ncbi:MAG: DUF1318 domain-containing protein [Candidatus Omnitrophica bacterium]|nr:DUF1318 domain-containing protein [Candidatus Omnitrophota bacterium]